MTKCGPDASSIVADESRNPTQVRPIRRIVAAKITPRTAIQARPALSFERLVTAIRTVDVELASRATRAVNTNLTLRNWLTGFYIAEFELHGADRAQYGDRLLRDLSGRLQKMGMSSVGRRQLYGYLAFYRAYPQIVRTVSAQLRHLLPTGPRPAAKLASPSSLPQHDADRLLNHLSYSHIEQLVDLRDDRQRAFYELECIRGNWSVRELRRQVGALTFERSGLAMNAQPSCQPCPPRFTVRDPYIFEFLGLKSREVMGESDLEDALLDKLQAFLLELGHGFCFEARQKRILIGETYGFVDLVFYHRVLKCHVLIELKLAEFNHEHLGQLNTYVSWFKRNVLTRGDAPPIGLLLCTRKDHALVEYALADLPNRLFVSRYQLELPSRERIQDFLDTQLRRREDGMNG